MTNTDVPCDRCHGTGREPTVLELWGEGLESVLRSLAWPDERIARVREELRPDEVLAGPVRWGGITLKSPDGRIRELGRFE